MTRRPPESASPSWARGMWSYKGTTSSATFHPGPRPSPAGWSWSRASKGRRPPTTPSSATRSSETSRTSSGTRAALAIAWHPTTARRASREACAKGEVAPLRIEVPPERGRGCVPRPFLSPLFTELLRETVREVFRAPLQPQILPLFGAQIGPERDFQRSVGLRCNHLRDFSDSLSGHL